jgi:hypothetical protein
LVILSGVLGIVAAPMVATRRKLTIYGMACFLTAAIAVGAVCTAGR